MASAMTILLPLLSMSGASCDGQWRCTCAAAADAPCAYCTVECCIYTLLVCGDSRRDCRATSTRNMNRERRMTRRSSLERG